MNDYRQPASPKGGFDIGLHCALLGVFLSAANFMTSQFAELGNGIGADPASPLEQIADLLSGNVVKSIAVVLLVVGGLLYATGMGYIELAGPSDGSATRLKPRCYPADEHRRANGRSTHCRAIRSPQGRT